MESKGRSNFGKVIAGGKSDKEVLRQSAAYLVSYCGERFQRRGEAFVSILPGDSSEGYHFPKRIREFQIMQFQVPISTAPAD